MIIRNERDNENCNKTDSIYFVWTEPVCRYYYSCTYQQQKRFRSFLLKSPNIRHFVLAQLPPRQPRPGRWTSGNQSASGHWLSPSPPGERWPTSWQSLASGGWSLSMEHFYQCLEPAPWLACWQNEVGGRAKTATSGLHTDAGLHDLWNCKIISNYCKNIFNCHFYLDAILISLSGRTVSRADTK